jgi:hypothetical protein
MARTKSQRVNPQKSLMTLKGDDSWLEWMKEFADFLGVPVSTVIDLSVREKAIRDKFPKPMPKRLPG